jgi:ADP-heptose:LPS heptosyltransferase
MIGVPLDSSMEYGTRGAGLTEIDGRAMTMFEPECARLVRNLLELGTVDLDDPANWELHLTEQEHARAAEVLAPLHGQKFFAVSFGAKKPANDWEANHWGELLSRVAEMYPQYGLAICGAGVERESSEFGINVWHQHSSHPALNLCGDLTPRESAAVFQRAAIFLGQDSGPQHLAAAVQTPCVIAFCAASMPGIWFPYGRQHHVIYHQVDCAGCGLEVCVVQKKKCMMAITVDEMLTAVRKTLPA